MCHLHIAALENQHLAQEGPVCMRVIESQTTNKKQSRKKRSQRIIKTQLDRLWPNQDPL